MKKKTLFVLFGSIVLYLLNAQSSTDLLINNPQTFCETDFILHGIAFNNKGLMMLGAGHSIYKVTPEKEITHFVTLDSITENTWIWSLRYGPDSCLYVAAKDQVVKVTPDGEQTQIIKIDTSNLKPWGAADLRFDDDGYIYIIQGDLVFKYDSNYTSTLVIDGKAFDPPLVNVAGMEFSNDFKYMYLGACKSKKIYIVPYKTENYVDNSKSYPSDWAQYFAKDSLGNVYVSNLGMGNPDLPEFVKFTSDHERYNVYCEKRHYSKKQIAIGGKGFNENAIYIASAGKDDKHGKIMVYTLED